MKLGAPVHSIRELFPEPRVLFAQPGAFGLDRFQLAVRIGILFHPVAPPNFVYILRF